MDEVSLKSLVSIDQVKETIENITGSKNMEIVHLEVEKANKGLKGLTSVVLRVQIGYKINGHGAIHKKSYVIKRLPVIDSQLDMVKKTGIFEKEVCYFSIFQPFARALTEGKMDLPIPLSDYSFSNGKEDIIFLDDLSLLNFHIAQQKFRVTGLDLPHCEIAMKLLGKLHAIAIATEEIFPDGMMGTVLWENLSPPLIKEICFYEAGEGEFPSVIFEMFENSMKTVVELSKNIEGLPKQAADSGVLEKILGRAWQKMCNLVSRDRSNDIKVLCHGDFWMNNIMFKYDEKKEIPVDAKAIDFQVTRYAHPCTDIFHLLYGCVRRNIREQFMDHLLEVYHKSFTETTELIDMKTPVFSLDQLKEGAYGQFRLYGVVIGALWHPVFMLNELYGMENTEQSEEEIFDEMLKNGNSDFVREKFMNDEIFRKEMEHIIGELLDVALPKGLQNYECSPFLE